MKKAVNTKLEEIVNRINSLSGKRTVYLSREGDDNVEFFELGKREKLSDAKGDKKHQRIVEKIIDQLIMEEVTFIGVTCERDGSSLFLGVRIDERGETENYSPAGYAGTYLDFYLSDPVSLSKGCSGCKNGISLYETAARIEEGREFFVLGSKSVSRCGKCMGEIFSQISPDSRKKRGEFKSEDFVAALGMDWGAHAKGWASTAESRAEEMPPEIPRQSHAPAPQKGSTRLKRQARPRPAPVQPEQPPVTPQEVYRQLVKKIKGQESAMRDLSLAVALHQCSLKDKDIPSPNVLLAGPTGCGKTHSVNALSELLSVPFVKIPAAQIAPTSYVGTSLGDYFQQLVQKAGSKERAERSIVFIDEIDKLRDQGPNGLSTRRAVQEELLVALSGGDVPLAGGSPGAKSTINTSKMLFIGAGAFSGMIEGPVSEKAKKGKMGLIQAAQEKESPRQRPSADQLIKWGLSPELTGRFSVIGALKPLGRDTLKDILDVEGGPLKMLEKTLGIYAKGVKIKDCLKEHIVDKALEKGTGARALFSIANEVLSLALFRQDMIGEESGLDLNTYKEMLKKDREEEV